MLPLNADALASLREFMSPQELGDFLGRVQAELRQAWALLESHHQAQDWMAVQKGAHRLKGSVGSAGCDPLFEALHRLEMDLRAQPARLPAPAQWAALAQLTVHTNAALQQAIDQA